MFRYENHAHTHKSNIVNRDSTIFEDKLIDKALELNLKGVSITDHGNLCAHVDALLHLKKLREEAKKNLDIALKDEGNIDNILKAKEEYEKIHNFTLGLGTEIYLVDREIINEAREKYIPTKFYHLVLVAKNIEGYKALCELSSNSWEEAFHYRGMQRIPTYKDYFFEWAARNKGNIIVSSACLGSEFSQLILAYVYNKTDDNRKCIVNFINNMLNLFGEDFYIEIQPSHFEEQIAYNKCALEFAEEFGIKAIITTDAHYLREDKKKVHSIFLKSQNAERETDSFYSSTYLMDCNEICDYFKYITNEKVKEIFNNSIELSNKIEFYDLYQNIEVPRTTLKLKENHISIFNNNQYNYLNKFINSEYDIDRILIQQIEEGIIKKNITITEEVLERLEVELEALWEISKKLHQRLASYYLLTKEIVEIMWRTSLVGVSRGSAGAFYICYLLDICQINPIKSEFNLDYWRHVDKSKIELSDIDLDTEKAQRSKILELVKQTYGEDHVLNICTFKTEGSASAIQTMCRGLGISTEDSSYLSSLVVEGFTVKQCLENYNSNKECEILIKEMSKYEDLIECVIEIEGLCNGRSSHASGVYLFNKPYYLQNAMMRTPNGLPVTQFDMSCSDYMGGLKLDFLTISNLDRIRKAMDLLIEDGIFEDKGNLKSTYDHYLHPDVIEKDDKGMWLHLCNGEVLDAFQFDSPQGKSAIEKIQPSSFQEALDGNALMRLSVENSEQPIDKYVKYKKDINLWYKHMMENGLVESEMQVLKEHLLKSYGIAATQESVMRMSMDERIAGFTLQEANKLRKAIAKAKAKHMIKEVHELFINKGVSLGNRLIFLNYVWENYIVPQLGYAFSEPHLAGYTLILVQEMNLSYIYSSLHWKTACLCVNAGDISEDVSTGTNYGAIAKATGDMKKGFIKPPNINRSNVGFKPDIKTQTVLFGLGAINSISMDLAREIISLRPYSSFEDFLKKCVDTKIVQPSKVYNLIKSGAFDDFKSRVELLVDFINYQVPSKKKLTTSNIPKLIEYGIIPKNLNAYEILYMFRKQVMNKNNLVELSEGKAYRIPNNNIDYFNKILHNHLINYTVYDDLGNICLKEKEFEAIYKKLITPLTDWIKTEDAVARFNWCSKNVLWQKYCIGNESKWEMESLGFYCTTIHEIELMGIERYHSLTSSKTLPSVPEYYYEKNPRTNKCFKKFKTYLIAGTVVDKDKTKRLVTLNTADGVIDLKLSKDLYTHYDRKTEEEASWFSRGTKILVNGYKRGNNFIPKVYSDSIFSNSIMKIQESANGKIQILNERKIDIIC